MQNIWDHLIEPRRRPHSDGYQWREVCRLSRFVLLMSISVGNLPSLAHFYGATLLLGTLYNLWPVVIQCRHDVHYATTRAFNRSQQGPTGCFSDWFPNTDRACLPWSVRCPQRDKWMEWMVYRRGDRRQRIRTLPENLIKQLFGSLGSWRGV